MNVTVREQMGEIVVNAGQDLGLGRARVDNTVTTALIDDLVLAHASVATSVGQATTAIVARVGQAEVDHLLASLASIASLADAAKGARVLLALAAVLAGQGGADARAERGALGGARSLLGVPEEIFGAAAHGERELAGTVQVHVLQCRRQSMVGVITVQVAQGARVLDDVTAVETDSVGAAAVEAVDLIDTGAASASSITFSQALVNVDLALLAAEAFAASATGQVVLVDDAFAVVFAVVGRAHWRVIALGHTVVDLLAEVGADGALHGLVDIDVGADQVALSVPRVGELGTLGLSQNLFRARVLESLFASGAGPRLVAVTGERAALDGLASAAVQALVGGAQVILDLAVDADTVGRAHALEAAAEAGLASLVGGTRVRGALGNARLTSHARPAPRASARERASGQLDALALVQARVRVAAGLLLLLLWLLHWRRDTKDLALLLRLLLLLLLE